MSDDDSKVANMAEEIKLKDKEITGSPYRLLGLTGNFGKIHLARNVDTGEVVAIKLVLNTGSNTFDSLQHEYEMYRKIGTVPGLPKIHFFGKCDPYDAMVMELLGPSLDQVLVYCNNRFSLRTTTMLAVQMLDIIQYIHTQKIIFCNVKPENFCLGHPCTPTANRVHLIGFNYAKVFETDQQKHIPKTNVKCDEQSIKGGFGTPRYMSLNAHKCKELSRRDDLESIGYLLLYFVNGQLPWQGMHIPNEYERYERIYMMKKTVKLEELCYGLPSEYYHYMLYVRTLKFAQEPNYRYLIKMFTRMLSRMNIDQCTQSTHFDWDRTQSQSICRGVDKEPSTPSKKQVSFKQDADLINIHSDMYFPFLRNTNLASVRNLNYPDH